MLINRLIPLATYVDVLGQQVVGSLVLLEEIAVGGATGEEAAEKEAEESGRKVRNASIPLELYLGHHSPSTESSQGFSGRKRRHIGHSSSRGAKGSCSESAAAGGEDS